MSFVLFSLSVDISSQKFEGCIDLLLITDEKKSHHVYIKDLCAIRQDVKIKNFFGGYYVKHS